MINSNEYIFFEADQVLTNDHLNESFNYLDHQARWTRNKLIGIGIACGLEIVIHSNGIEITKGCGVTSQGYLIVQPKEKYTWYMNYSQIPIPADLPFKHGTDLPFYEGYGTSGTQIYLLLTDDQQKALDPAKKASAVAINTTNGFLDNYAVALFLEAKETDLKNCDMLDCNNMGEKMVFTVRPLLVPTADLLTLRNGMPDKITLTQNDYQINLKRYNVPYKPLKTSIEVLEAFYAIVDNAVLTELSDALNYLYEEYGTLLKLNTNPFVFLLAELKLMRERIFKQVPYFIEYFYDFIDDLIKAYYELSEKVADLSECCPDVNLFPLHLILGSASQSTDAFLKDPYRDYFIYSGLFSKMDGDAAEATLLFKRIIVMLREFAIQTEKAIIITPSQYEWPPLSARAIPYYYFKAGVHMKPFGTEKLNQVFNLTGNGDTELYKYWNYEKTLKNEETLNLSYHANSYTSKKPVVDPLLYDIEKYNFFRIEGHIGQNYRIALERILLQRAEYNLPFDVVAVSADQLTLSAPLPECSMQDLDTAYKLIIGDAACKIHTLFCYISNMPFRSGYDEAGNDGTVIVDKAQENTNTGDTEINQGVYTLGNASFSSYKVKGALEFETPITISATYKRGDFLRKNCPPAERTLGWTYLRSLDSNGEFRNPLQSSLIRANGDKLLVAEYHFFQFIEFVEDLMFVLYTHTLAEINIELLVRIYREYLEMAVIVIRLLLEAADVAADNSTTDSAGNTTDYVSFDEAGELILLTDELSLLLSLCVDERIDVLKREYMLRLRNYQQQLTFFNYYKKHPGLEHKAGVPKGGTFVLVYDGESRELREPVNAVGIIVERGSAEVLGTTTGEPVATPSPYSTELTKMIMKFVEDCKDAPPKTKTPIITALNPPVIGTRRGLTEGAVIADFYIPYLCCSDCPPVAYIMPEPRPLKIVKPIKPVEQPVINAAGPFCSNDSSTAQLSGTPTGGTFGDSTGAAITGINANGSFVPANLTPGSYDVYYTVARVTSAKTTIVITDAGSDFTFPAQVNGVQPSEIEFDASNVESGVTYQWQITPENKQLKAKDSTTDAKFLAILSPQVQNENPDGVSVTLTIANGACKSTTTKTFKFTINGSQSGVTVTQLGS
ncbi:hypothetical protein SAMN05216490_4149 [Mucilaginibacter mallensis]|uniref:Uncharacterized protein n=1 Tax=Mucilaginibacter mallensis TaxID=652787 RepID=A0A1H2BIL1_MUCMA|nr:hypothetical protein [Mucilaginibacter mallensis]SDT58085.1 hypothetical protein SAMN05216490_4149 [Mucilaginibacter mallensis]